MPSTSKTGKRGRGRPRVDATPVQVRMPPAELEALDRWIADQHKKLTRPQAIRHLVDQALRRQRRPGIT